jgi:hypothetical protein
MKLQASGVKVETFGVEESSDSDFIIHNSAIAFKILSSGLYSDPVRAILRELGTNAMDAHIMAGKPELPFKIHLPTRFESWFSIKDEGIGMTEEQIRTNYCGYFGSTKRSDNAVTGCFGLGSKSPFSYTETFSVTSVIDGVKSVYTAYVAPEGKPKVNKLSMEETEEPNSVEVMFPVRTEHIWDYTQKAKSVYRDFPVWPESNVPLELVRVEHSPEGTAKYEVKLFRDLEDGSDPIEEIEEHELTWGIRKGNWNNPVGDGVRVILGPVAYPLDQAQISFTHPMLKSNLDIRIAMGDVEMTPSRESLNYTDFTKANLKSAFEAIGKSISTAYLTELNKCNKRIEALILMSRWRNNNQQLYNVIYEAAKGFDFEKFKISSDKITINQTEFLGVGIYELDYYHNGPKLNPKTNSKNERLELKAGRNSWLEKDKVFLISKELVLVYQDVRKAGFKSMVQRAKSQGEFEGKELLILVPTKDAVMQPTGKNKWIEDVNAFDDAMLLSAEFDTEITLASELFVKYPAPKTEKGKVKSTRTRLLEKSHRGDGSDFWKLTYEDVEDTLANLEGDTKYFFYITGFSVDDTITYKEVTQKNPDTGLDEKVMVPDDQIANNQTLGNIFEKLQEAKILEADDVLFGVNTKDKDKIKDDPEWVNIFEYAREYLANSLSQEDKDRLEFSKSKHTESLVSIIDIGKKQVLEGTLFKELIEPFTPIAQVIKDAYQSAYQSWHTTTQTRRIQKLNDLFSVLHVPHPPVREAIQEVVSQISETYPWLFSGVFERNDTKMIEYILLVDNAEKAKQRILQLESDLSEARSYVVQS